MLKLKETVFDTPSAPKVTAVLDDEEISKQDVITLTTPQAVRWGRMRYLILSLPNNSLWKNIIALTSLINFFLGTTCFFIARSYLHAFIPIYILCDALYCFNLILLSLHLFWKQLRKQMFTVRVSKLTIMLDIVSLLPQELIVIAIFGDSTVALYMRWITFIRLRYLGIYFANLQEVLEKRWKYTLMTSLIIAVVNFHLSTCIFYQMSCHHLRCVEKPNEVWFEGKWSQTIVNSFPYYETAGTFDWYILSIYMSMEYLFNYGTGVVPANILEEFFIFSLLMMIGYIIFSIWILFTTFETIVFAKRHEANYIHKVECITLFLRDVNASKKVISNIKEYFNILWQKKDGVKSAAHFDSLPSPLQMEIMYDLNCVHLNRSLLLYDLKEFYLRTISLFMKHEFMLPGDILYHQGVVKTNLVIIIKGVLEILSDEDDDSPILAFQGGTVLGEACLFLSLPSNATVRAAVYTEVKLIDRVDFTRNISNYPIAFSYLRERVLYRIRTMRNQTTLKLNNMLQVGSNDQDNMIPIKSLKNKLIKRQQKKTGILKKGESDASSIKGESQNTSKFCTQLLPLYQLSLEDSNVEKPVICITYEFPFILDSTCSLVKYWEYLVLMIHYAAIFFFTYEIVFIRSLTDSTDTLLIWSDAVSFIDVLLLTCTTVVFKDRVLKTFKDIIAYRIKCIGFYVYIISVLPISYILEITLSTLEPLIHSRTSDLLSSIKVLRLLRCRTILASMKYQGNAAYNVMSALIYLLLTTYFFACIMYLHSCFTVICTEGTWIYEMIKGSIGRLEYTIHENIFPTSMYVSTITWSHMGMTNYHVFPKDIYLAMITIVVGLIITIYLVASLAAILYINKSKSEQFVRKALSLQRFLDHSHVPADLKDQVSRHFTLQWSYDGSIGRKEFKKMAPEHLQMIVYKTDLMNLLKRVPLFKLVDVDFLMHVVLSSTITVLPSNATVCYSGDVDREMFIIQKGNCVVLDSGGNFVRDMKSGDFYGDIEMLFNMTKTATVRTTTNCKIMVITFRDFSSALSMFPTEMRIAHKFMYDNDLYRQVDIIEQKRMISFMQMKPSELKKKKLWMTIIQKFKQSFIYSANCYKNTKKREKYWDPFDKMGKWKIIGFLLLPVTIHPNSWILKLWISLRMCLLIAMAACFPRSIGLPPNLMSTMHTIIIITEMTAYLEMYFFLHIAYYDEKGLLISHPKFTAKNYLTHNFIMDLVAAFPYYAIINYIQSNHRDNLDPTIAHLVKHDSYCVWRCMALLQFHRVIGLVKHIQGDLFLKKNKIIYAIILVSVFLFLYLMSVIIVPECQYTFSILEMGQAIDETRNSIQIPDENGAITYIGYFSCNEVSWPHGLRYCPGNPTSVITCAFTWFLDIFCHNGTGNMEPYSTMDVVIIVALNCIGFIIISFIMVYSISTTTVSSTLSIAYQQKVEELLNFLHNEGVSEVKINKIFRYFEYVWKRTIGMEDREMVNELNSSLRGDIALFMYEKTLREVAIFQKIARPYLKVLAKNLKEEYFLKSDRLIKSYDVHNCVYIIMRGKVEVYTPYDELVTTIGVGGLFGNIHQASPGCSTSTFVALRNVDALRMTSETFFLLAQEYPEINDVLFSVLNIVGDFILPTQQARKYQSMRGSDVFSHVSSEYEEDIYSDDVDIMSGYEKDTFEEVIVTDIQPKIDDGKDKGKEKENKKTSAAPRVIIPKNTFLVLLLFFKPKYWFKFALEPNHRFFEYVRYATFMSACYQVFIIPYVAVSLNVNPVLTYPSYFVEPIFYLRIFFFMHEAYLDEYGTYEKRFKMIAKHQLKDYKGMCWNLIPNIPLYLMAFMLESEEQKKISRYLRLFQVLRFKYIYDSFAEWSAPLIAKRAQILFFKMLFNFLLFIHYCTLILILNEVLYPNVNLLPKRKKFRDSGYSEVYALYLYLTCNVLSSSGVGDYPPQAVSESYLISLYTVLSKLLFASLIAFMSTMSMIVLQHLLRYEFKVKKLIKFLENQGLSDHLMKKLWMYVKKMWTTQSGVHIPELLETAPYVLRCEIMREIYSVHLRNGYLFKDINEALLSQICGHLKRIIFFRGNYIVQNGDTNASMYWIHRGEVSVLTVHPNLTETCHEMLHVHDMFGLAQGLNYGMAHKFSYRAETQCDILVLKLEAWESVLQHFPKDKDTIFKRMLNAYTIL